MILLSEEEFEKIVNRAERRVFNLLNATPKVTPGGDDPMQRYAKHFGISRQEAKSRLFNLIYGRGAGLPGFSLSESVDALIRQDQIHQFKEGDYVYVSINKRWGVVDRVQKNGLVCVRMWSKRLYRPTLSSVTYAPRFLSKIEDLADLGHYMHLWTTASKR